MDSLKIGKTCWPRHGRQAFVSFGVCLQHLTQGQTAGRVALLDVVPGQHLWDEEACNCRTAGIGRKQALRGWASQAMLRGVGVRGQGMARNGHLNFEGKVTCPFEDAIKQAYSPSLKQSWRLLPLSPLPDLMTAPC